MKQKSLTLCRQQAQGVLKAIRSCLPGKMATAGLHEPLFRGNEWTYVKECLDSGWVSSVGSFVDKFEEELSRCTGARYAVAVVNGTSALHIALLLAGVRKGDEVLMPAMTFVATANAVTYCGAVPHFVDVEERTLGVSPTLLAEHLGRIAARRGPGWVNRKTGRRIRALVPVHTFGHPVDLNPLVRLCREFRLEMVEDAAEALGSYYNGRHAGTVGRLGVLSFNGNKTITTGGGGAILTNRRELGREAKHLASTAKVPHSWAYRHNRTGYNYRMPNLNAALGCAQLEILPKLLIYKRKVADRYRDAFREMEGIRFFTEPEFARSNYWLNAILLDRPDVRARDRILRETNRVGIATRPVWTPMHRLPMYSKCPRMELAATEEIEARLINLPSSPALGAAGP